ncbi:hypothetical protein PE067_11790 [Paracoccus sp. DMF-8]|uniref:hypothetical protein n=1 Tax=Paracoccus sp. DMF-8 TaxID=3019445 RepID=UPI0023E7F7E6|nr:hypothetical protein [Paracoccus sp. DMF-8]MDF3606748.1 hypothetical protein [Paracoccus sp. DMF-8]
MTEFSAILVGNGSLLRHAAEVLMSRGHRIVAVVTRNADLRDWARRAGLQVEDQDAPVAADVAGRGPAVLSVAEPVDPEARDAGARAFRARSISTTARCRAWPG